jgi:sugar phosphate isomerase/epimerase
MYMSGSALNVSRRTFLARSAGLVIAANLPRAVRSDPLGLPVGIQLWTVRESLQADPGGTLEQLRRIGYRTVESAGFAGLSAEDFRRRIDDAGLLVPSAHLDFRSGDWEAIFGDAHTLGAHYAVSSILRPGTGAVPAVGPSLQKVANVLRAMTLDDAKQTAELANRIGERAKRAGLQYAYHNHFFEFVDQGNGAVAYDVLLRETDPTLVQFEIDCGWMRAAGHDPIAYFKQYPHRFPMIHVKDFLAVTGENAGGAAAALRVGTELGTGFIDYKPIFAAAKSQPLKYYFAEQEGPFTRMTQLEAAKVSYDYLHAL